MTVIVPLPPSYRGGTEEYAYRVALNLSSQLPVEILTTRVRLGHDPVPLPTGSIPVRYLDGRELFERPVVSGRGLDELRGQVERSSLVQLHMPFPRVEARVVRWAGRRGIPVVLTYHMDADLSGATGRPGAGLVTALYRRFSAFPALAGASAVVSNSLGYARASPVLSRYLAKVRVIHKGVDVARLGLDPSRTDTPPRDPVDPGLFPRSAPEVRRVVFVGRLVPYKGLPVLIEAVGRLIAEGIDVKLFIAGRGPQLAELQGLAARPGLSGRVEFLGFVPDDRLGELYSGADVVACPSISLLESTATCLEEAAAFGIPVLGSSLPGAEETVPSDGVHGILAPPGDVGAVSDGLRRLLGQPRPTRRGPFRTWEETTSEYLELFQRLLNLDRGPSPRGKE